IFGQLQQQGHLHLYHGVGHLLQQASHAMHNVSRARIAHMLHQCHKYNKKATTHMRAAFPKMHPLFWFTGILTKKTAITAAAIQILLKRPIWFIEVELSEQERWMYGMGGDLKRYVIIQSHARLDIGFV
ncbi:hypothetical protein ACJX0J_040572, partial [Zea mays]